MEETDEIEVEIGNPEWVTKIGKGLQGNKCQAVIDLIRKFLNIFVWDPT